MEPWPANEKEFSARAKDAKARLNLVGQEIARLVGAVLAEYHALQKALPGFRTHVQATQDIKQQLEWLLGKDWVAHTPYERLQHLPRYLKAINIRLEKLRANPSRDAQQLAQLIARLRTTGRFRMAVTGTARVAVRTGVENAGDCLGKAAAEGARRAQPLNRFAISTALLPPKANEFDITASSMTLRRPSFGT